MEAWIVLAIATLLLVLLGVVLRGIGLRVRFGSC